MNQSVDFSPLPDERIDRVNENIVLIQKKNGLTFGTDAFLLASFIRSVPKGHAVDLGTGTGIISLLLAARERFLRISAFEIQPDFASLAKRNVALNRLEHSISVFNKSVLDVSSADIGGEADVVFTNPPYMKVDCGKPNLCEYKYIARHEVCGDIEDFCRAGFRLLKHGGKFYVVWRPDRLTDLFAALRQSRLEPKIVTFVCADVASAPSMVLVSATKGGASGCKVTPPLFLHKDVGSPELSDTAKKIYDTMSF